MTAASRASSMKCFLETRSGLNSLRYSSVSSGDSAGGRKRRISSPEWTMFTRRRATFHANTSKAHRWKLAQMAVSRAPMHTSNLTQIVRNTTDLALFCLCFYTQVLDLHKKLEFAPMWVMVKSWREYPGKACMELCMLSVFRSLLFKAL